MPGPTYVNSQASGTTGAYTTTFTVNLPAARTVGNMLLAFVYGCAAGATNPALTAPGGWTPVNSAANAQCRCSAYTRTVDGTETASYGWTASVACEWTAVVAQYSAGVADASSNANGTATPWASTAFTSGNAGDTVVVGNGNGPNNGTSNAYPAGTTQRVNTLYSSGGGGAYINLCDAAPATTSVPAYSAAMFSNVPWATVAVALSAAVTGTAVVLVGPVTVAAAPAAAGCARGAWLALDGGTVPLEDPAGGWFCANLDIGYPTVRAVMTNRPDNTGVVDRTQYLGERVITADINAVAGAGARIDAVAALFAPFMDPSARPRLFYVLDRPGAPQRVLTVRAAGYSWPVAGGAQRAIHLQFVAADPTAYDPTVKTATATPAAGASLAAAGDVAVRPLIRVTGPVTGPAVALTPPASAAWQLAFLATFTIPAGHHVDIDTDARTVLYDSDPAQGRLSSLDWARSSWQAIPPGTTAVLTLAGTATTGATQAQASWQNGYLT